MNSSGFAAVVIRFRWLFIALFSAVSVWFGLQIPRAQLDTDMKTQLPKDLPTRINLDRIEAMFGGTDMAMIVVSAKDVLATSTLQRLKTLTDRMQNVHELERVVSLFTAKDLRGEGGDMIVDNAVPAIPLSAKDRESLRKRLRSNPLVFGNLVSTDFRYAVLVGFVHPKAKDEKLVNELESLVHEVPGPEATYVGGMPVTRVSLTRDMQKDMRRFLPVGLLLMLVFLLACFRQAWGVILPFVMTVMAIAVVMGLIPLFGWKIHTVTILLPVILLAVANDYGIHLLARYQEDNAPGIQISSRELATRGIQSLMGPTLACGVTTMVGLASLVTHIIIPAKQLGVLAALGVGFAMIGSLVFIPAVLSVLPRAKPVFDAGNTRHGSNAWLDRLLALFGSWVARRPKTILLTALATATVMGIGASRVVVDTNPMSFYRETEPIWKSTHLLNQHLGGWAGVSVIAEGDIKDPKVLRQIDDLEQHLKKNPLVGTTSSIADVMRKMNQVMHDGDPAYDRVPESRQLVAQYLLLYSMSGDQKDLEKLVDFPYRHAELMVKVTDSGTRAATEVLHDIRSYLAEHRGGSMKFAGGLLDVMADMVHHIVWGQVTSMLLAGLLVGLLVAILMRSAVAGLLGLFPLTLSLAVIFGVMGFFDIELNIVSALLSSIMIGVGVDYSIHFMWRYREERRQGTAPEQAVERTLTTTGRGIVFNALSVVVGFIVLVISAFFPVRFFGLLVAISILASLVGALVVLPAAAVVFRPKVFEPRPRR